MQEEDRLFQLWLLAEGPNNNNWALEEAAGKICLDLRAPPLLAATLRGKGLVTRSRSRRLRECGDPHVLVAYWMPWLSQRCHSRSMPLLDGFP